MGVTDYQSGCILLSRIEDVTGVSIHLSRDDVRASCFLNFFNMMIVSQHASPELVFGSSFGIHLSELRFLLRKFSWRLCSLSRKHVALVLTVSTDSRVHQECQLIKVIFAFFGWRLNFTSYMHQKSYLLKCLQNLLVWKGVLVLAHF